MSKDPLDALDSVFDAVGDFFSEVSRAFKSGPAETRAERARTAPAPEPPAPPAPPSPPRYTRPERPQRTTATGATGSARATPRTAVGNQVVGGANASMVSSIRTGRSGGSEGEVVVGAGSRSTSMQVHSAGAFTVSSERPSESHTIAFRGDRVLVDGVDVTDLLRDRAAGTRTGSGAGSSETSSDAEAPGVV